MNRLQRLRAAALVLICAGSGAFLLVGPPAGAASAPAAIADYQFTPGIISIHLGDTVTWHNNGPSTHTVTADDGSFGSGPLSSAATFSHVFHTAGTFAYHCSIHPVMTGQVQVTAAATTISSTSSTSTSAPTSPSTSTSAPSTATTAPADLTSARPATISTGQVASQAIAAGVRLPAAAAAARVAAAPAAVAVTRSPLGPHPAQLPATGSGWVSLLVVIAGAALTGAGAGLGALRRRG